MRNKSILPGYVPPLKNELLSSWMFRLAQEHKIKPQSFTKFYFDAPFFWSRDVDKSLPARVLKSIVEVTPLDMSEVKELQLDSYSGVVFEGELISCFTEGISNLGIYHRTRNRKGLLVCPMCLDKEPIYRKDWRLLSSIVCVECMCRLIDECPKCNSPIVFQRLEIGDKANFKALPIYLCSNCMFDLRKISTPIGKNSIYFEYQNYIDKTIENGFNNNVSYSFLYFKILFLLLRRVKTISRGRRGRIRDAFLKEFNLEGEEFYSQKIITSLNFRFKNLPIIYYLLSDIENKFVPFCEKYKIRYSDFHTEIGIQPFWFTKIFMEFF